MTYERARKIGKKNIRPNIKDIPTRELVELKDRQTLHEILKRIVNDFRSRNSSGDIYTARKTEDE